MMKDMLWLIRKTLASTLRKKSSWIVFFLLPLVGVMLSLMLYGYSNGVSLRVGIVNADGEQPIAQDTIRYVEQLSGVKVSMTDTDSLNKNIAKGKLDSGLVIGQGFSDSVRAGQPDRLQLVSVKGASVTAYVRSMLDGYVSNLAAIGKTAGGDAGTFDKLYEGYANHAFKAETASIKDESHVKDLTYQAIGFLLMFMMFSSVNLSELILKERENRTYLRLLSSPVPPRTYFLSNVAVSIGILLLQIVVTLVFMKNVFHIDSGIPFGELLAALMLFALAAIALSFMVVSFSKSSKGAGALQNLIVTPTCLLSGCFFPIDIMPDTVRKISNFLPQHWLLDTLTKLQDGKPLGSLYLNLAIMVAFAAAFTLIAIYRMSRNNDVRQFV